MKAIERDFPTEALDPIAERESWRKEVNRPIYHIHKWWANRLGSVFRAILLGTAQDEFTWDDFYQPHNFLDFTVMDPFMGSGTTVGEALKLGMRAIGCDINPVSTFQVKQALTRVDHLSLDQAFRHLELTVAPQIQEFYRTKHHETSEWCSVLYHFWVKVVTTPEGEDIPLFANYVFSRNAYPSKKPQSQILCKSCGHVFVGRFDSREAQCTDCGFVFDPQDGPVQGAVVRDSKGHLHKIKDLVQLSGEPPKHRHYATMALTSKGEKFYQRATPYDQVTYDRASALIESQHLPLPTMEIRPGHNTDQARGYNYRHWRDCFNDRQLACLGLLLGAILKIEDEDIQEQLLCLFSSTLEFNNLFCSFKGEGTGAVRHMFSHHILKPERQPLENSVWGTPKSSGAFSTLYKSRLLKAKAYLDQPFEVADGEAEKWICSDPMPGSVCSNYEDFLSGRCALILNGDSADLPIPSESVDAVVTDPPYFDFVHYSELSDFFYSWLSVALHERHAFFRKLDSSDPGEVQDKSPEMFAKNLCRVFRECHRCLKADGHLIFSFHHSRAEAWAAIYSAVTEAGFQFVAAHPIKAEMSVGSPKVAAANPINLDAILVCKKSSGGDQQPLIEDFQERSCRAIERLGKAGRKLSRADVKVIKASEALVDGSAAGMSIDGIHKVLAGVFADPL